MLKPGLHPCASRRRGLWTLGLLAALNGGWPAWAQEAIYRCANEYTNIPRDVRQCERLAPQAITVIVGTQPAAARAVDAGGTAANAVRSGGDAARAPAPPLSERDAQARTIVSHELEKARQQLTSLVQEYNGGEPVKWASESRHHQKYLDRVAMLKAAIERTQRDIDSLQRELERRPALASTRTP